LNNEHAIGVSFTLLRISYISFKRCLILLLRLNLHSCLNIDVITVVQTDQHHH